MNQEKSINLFLQGKDAWNAWALRLLRRKRQLISAGEWFINREFDFEAGYYRTVGLNEATANWLERAFVDFSCLRFIAGDDTSNKSKARNREEKKYINSRDIPLEGMNIDFRGFIFPADLRFDHSELHGVVLFNEAIFHGTAWFSNTAFLGDCWFEAARFEGLACFHQAEFASFTTFALSRFADNANFEAIRAGRSFDLSNTEFSNEVPDFIDAAFNRPPRLAEVTILPPPKPARFSPRIRAVIMQHKKAPRSLRSLMLKDLIVTEWVQNRLSYARRKFFNARRKRADEAHYSALRKVAQKAGDYKAERKFYAGQVRARRHLADKLSNIPYGFVRYCFGALYEVTANFGRSLWRPALCWAAVFYLFAGLYLASAPASLLQTCVNTPAISPAEAAKTIAARNAFLIYGESADVDVRRAKRCLSLAAAPESKYVRRAPLPETPMKDQARLAALEQELEGLPLDGSEAPSEMKGERPAQKDDYAGESETASNMPDLPPDLAFMEDDITGSLPGLAGYTRLELFQMILHLAFMALFLFVLRNQIRLR